MATETETKTKKHVPDSTGTIVVKGMEKQADALRLNLAYEKKLKVELSTGKELFRSAAAGVLADAAPGAKAVLFRGDDGVGIRCAPPDVSKESSRTALKPALLQTIDIEETFGAGVAETVHKVALEGKWAQWFTQQIEAFRASGKLTDGDMEGIETMDVVRLTASGVTTLRAVSDPALQEKAQALLNAGLKAATITAK